MHRQEEEGRIGEQGFGRFGGRIGRRVWEGGGRGNMRLDLQTHVRRNLLAAPHVSQQALVEEGESASVTERDAHERRSSGLVNSSRASLPFLENSSPEVIPQLGLCHET